MSSSDIIGDIVICMGSSSISMKLHRFPRAFWDHVQPAHEPQPTEAAVCKRLRSLAPKMDDSNESFSVADSYELKSFIKPDSGPRRLSTYTDEAAFTKTHLSADQETHAGGTRWNPTQGQIGLLEMLYKGGIRTPNAHQIEQIAEKLAKYGKIEGKNVFYWFQNHKARERQKQKRERLGHSHHPPSQEPATARSAMTTMLSSDIVAKLEDHGVGVSGGAHKRRCRSWTLDRSADEEEPNEANNNRSCRSDDEGSICRTLQLFPLHPEGKR